MNRRFALGLLVSFVLLGLLFWQVDAREVLAAFEAADPRLLAAAASVYLVALFGKVLRWSLVLGAVEHPPVGADPARRWLVFDALFFGFFCNYVLPARLGELGRSLLYARRSGVPIAAVITTVVVGRLLDAIVLAGLFFVALQVLPLPDGLPPWIATGARTVGLGALVVIVGLAFGVRWLPRRAPERRSGAAGLWDRALGLGVLVRDGLAIGRMPGRAAAAVAATTVIWLLEGTALWILVRAFGHALPVAGAALQTVAAAYASGAPAAPGGLGVHQWATVLALAPFGVPRSVATAVSLVATAYVWLWTLPLGLFGLWRQGGSIAEVRAEAARVPPG